MIALRSRPQGVSCAQRQRDMGCSECCLRCLRGVPYASLIATVLCFVGVALFCGCGHEALAGTEKLIQQHFAQSFVDYALLVTLVQVFQYVIYGTASFFFLYGVLLLAEGVYTTSAAKAVYGQFRTTLCGRCVSATFIFLTYGVTVVWMGVFALSALPVYVYFMVWSACQVVRHVVDNGTDFEDVCFDARQYGMLPWSASPGKMCGANLAVVCNTSGLEFTYHLFIATFAGAAATTIALLTYMMSSTYNYAVLKFLSRDNCCTKF